MPIHSFISLSSHGPLTTEAHTTSIQIGAGSAVLSQVLTTLSGSGKIFPIESSLTNAGKVLSNLTDLNSRFGVIQTFPIVQSTGFISSEDPQVVGYTPINKTKSIVQSLALSVTETYPRFISNYPITSIQSSVGMIGVLQTVNSTPVSGINITASDETGPYVINTQPASGSVFNDPSSPISFNLVDTQGSNVVSGSIFIYVNNLQLISGGLNVTPSLSGTTTFTQITPANFLISYTPNAGFSALSPVTVSGRAIDTAVPANSGILSYSYKVWSTRDLGGTITALPDTLSPYLTNLNPIQSQIDVLPGTNIQIGITDDHTGLNPASVSISVNDVTVVKSGTTINSIYALTTISGIDTGKGRFYNINPNVDFGYGEVVSVKVSGSDNFTPPNNLYFTYYFTTYGNANLQVSGIQIFENGLWKNFQVSKSYLTVPTGTHFRASLINTQNLGVSTYSTISCNMEVISGLTFTTVNSGRLDVEFSLVPNYYSDCHLNFHVEQVASVSGNVLSADVPYRILWGASYCYDPDLKLTYDKQVDNFVVVKDFGEYPTTSFVNYTFQATPQPTSFLSSSITAMPMIKYDLAGFIKNDTAFERGKTMNMRLIAKDLAGNELDYKWSFKIEN